MTAQTILNELEGLVILSELEHAVILAEAATGENAPDAHRPLTPREQRARVRFGDIAKMQDKAAEQIGEALATLNTVIAGAVYGVMFSGDTTTPAAALKALEELTATQPKAIRLAVEGATAKIAAVLAGVYKRAGELVRGEATRQGKDLTGLPLIVKPAAVFETSARAVAMAPHTRMIDRLQKGLAEPRTINAPTLDRALVGRIMGDDEPIPKGAHDQGRQATHGASNSGRFDNAEPLEPLNAWASEILDRNTCKACSHVDGKDYDTFEEARAAYPDFGGFANCAGGSRCRGTLVMEFAG